MSDIAELFARDPLSYTKEGGELKQIVAKLRESRGQFNLGAMRAGAAAKRAPAKKSAKSQALEGASLPKLDLSSLLNKGKGK